jgi:segregation and condensation protein B
MDELQNRVEAILFASGKGVTEEELAKYCGEESKRVKKALAKLQQELEQREGSLIISLHNNRWKMTVRGRYLRDVENIVSETELASPILRTLAVIAFKSPVLQSDIIAIRGQGAYEHIKELARQKFLIKEERGRSFLLKITDKFYNYFDVEGDEEIQDVFAKLREKQQTLGELEIVDTLPEEERQTQDLSTTEKNTLGELEIVAASPKTKERTQEDIAEEKDFLKRIDEGITAISKRVEEHTIPARKETDTQAEITEEKTEENFEKEKDADEIKEKKEIITEEQNVNPHSKQKKQEQEENQDPLQALESFAQQQEETEDEDYL